MVNFIRRFAIGCLAIVWSACQADPADSGTPGGYLFAMHDQGESEQFVALTDDPAVIAKLDSQLALPESERLMFINGPIAAGDGGHNSSWSWLFLPGQWDLTEISIELCDGRPSMVEAGLDYWIDTVGAFCPWGAYVKERLFD